MPTTCSWQQMEVDRKPASSADALSKSSGNQILLLRKMQQLEMIDLQGLALHPKLHRRRARAQIPHVWGRASTSCGSNCCLARVRRRGRQVVSGKQRTTQTGHAWALDRQLATRNPNEAGDPSPRSVQLLMEIASSGLQGHVALLIYVPTPRPGVPLAPRQNMRRSVRLLRRQALSGQHTMDDMCKSYGATWCLARPLTESVPRP
mmetsp:Transcript_159979/g.513297  ORF Transcript_159979/g.513297 Transcript_159979/m.513297 type:complete len:205 (-) Transcript_159979:1184-1798(-)